MGSGQTALGRQPDPGEGPGDELDAVRIWLLGGFRISVGTSRSIHREEWRLKKAANLVKLLALAPGHRLHRDQAAGLLWPEHDARAAANNLHHALYVARRTLGPFRRHPYFQGTNFGGKQKPTNNSVVANHFGRNKPDIFWDESGTGNSFTANDCDTSVPSTLCN